MLFLGGSNFRPDWRVDRYMIIGGGFKDFLCSSLFGEDFQVD